MVTSSIFRRLDKKLDLHFASFEHSVVLYCCRRNKIKSSQICQFLIKMLFLQRFVEKGIRSAHPPQKISKPRLFFNFFINQTFLVNIYVENTANLQSRAGRDVFGGVQPKGCAWYHATRIASSYLCSNTMCSAAHNTAWGHMLSEESVTFRFVCFSDFYNLL